MTMPMITKQGRKKMLIVIAIVLASIMVLFLGFKIYESVDSAIFDSKESFTAEEVGDAVTKIYRQSTGFKSGVRVNYWSEKKEGLPKNNSLFKSADTSLLNPQNFYISTDGGGALFKGNYEPKEITASFECLLYFSGKNLPGGLIGVMNAQTTGGIDNYRPNISFISVTEFEEICTEVDITDLSRREAAKKLAEYWIKKHNYVKR